MISVYLLLDFFMMGLCLLGAFLETKNKIYIGAFSVFFISNT